MNHELLFRVIALVLFISGTSIGLYFRRRAARTGEKISRKEEGLFLLIGLRLLGFTIFFFVLSFIFYPPWIQWSTFQIPTGMRWFGVILGGLSLPMFYWVFHSLGMNVTDTVATRKHHTLITTGPYHWVRHPLYSSALLSWTGFGLLSESWFFLLMVIMAFALLLIRTSIEEAKLIEKFGKEYKEYMELTGRFFPRFNKSEKE